MTDTPRDWESPDWNDTNRVHNWKNHITSEIKAMWGSFTDAQKKALARQAEACSAAEDWE